jgi:hypothetical protein
MLTVKICRTPEVKIQAIHYAEFCANQVHIKQHIQVTEEGDCDIRTHF